MNKYIVTAKGGKLKNNWKEGQVILLTPHVGDAIAQKGFLEKVEDKKTESNEPKKKKKNEKD